MDTDVTLFLLLVLIIVIVFTIFGVLVYSGIFAFPQIRTDSPPINYNCTFAYQFLRGPYSGNDVGAAFTMVTSIAPKALAVGIYYDDPKRVPEHKLRCAVGCLISRDEVVTAKADTSDAVDDEPETIFRSFIDEREEELLKKKGFRICNLPAVDLAVVTEFPYTTPFSIWLAPGKVYPRFYDYISSKGLCAYPFIEVYADNRIRYMAPLSKQEDFFVPEAKDDADELDSSERASSTDTASQEKSLHVTGAVQETKVDRKPDTKVDRNPTKVDEKPKTEVDQEPQTKVDHEPGMNDDPKPEMAGKDEAGAETTLRRRKNVLDSPASDLSPATEEELANKRKESSQSSTGSSFEELSVDQLK